jgi:hypothetical protein
MYINICICRRCVYPRRVHLDVNNTARKEGERERGGSIGRGQEQTRHHLGRTGRPGGGTFSSQHLKRPKSWKKKKKKFSSKLSVCVCVCVCDRCECVVGAQPNTRMNQREPMATIPIHQPADCGVTKPLRREPHAACRPIVDRYIYNSISRQHR